MGIDSGGAGRVAPPVVAVVVIHRASQTLGVTLRSLALQDYPGLQYLAVCSGGPGDPGAQEVVDLLATHLPRAVVRHLGSNPGYAAAVNTVLSLVEGESGFFCLLHDDVDLAPDAISRLVEELYRTNAGVVGPKLVAWNDPTVIDSVGEEVDRLGERDPVADEGERDQEQHDAVLDVFLVSSACMLVRADLFREIGGMNPRLQVTGADLDFCWRVHLTGARVVIAPSAVARHLRATTSRLSSTNPQRLEQREEEERVRTTLALTPGKALPLIVARLFVFALGQAAICLATGRPKRAWALLRALLLVPGSISMISARRQKVARHRVLTEAEMRGLHVVGSARVRGYLRRRARVAAPAESEVNLAGDRVVTTRRASVITWVALATFAILGARSILLNGSAVVGQFVPFGGSVSDYLGSYSSGWWPAGLGDTVGAPIGTVLTAVWGALFLGRMGLAHSVAIVGLPLVGYLGAWTFASVFGLRRARIVTTVAYAAVPLPYAAVSAGRWGALLSYAALPWACHCMRILVGHRAVSEIDPTSDDDGFASIDNVRRRRIAATLVMLIATTIAFEPGFAVILGLTALVFAVVTAILGAPVRGAIWIAAAAASVALAAVLHFPRTIAVLGSDAWTHVSGAPVDGGRRLGIAALMRFDVGNVPLGTLFLLVYTVVFAAVLLVRGSRTPWAFRGATLVAATLLLALLDDRALLPVRLVEPATLLVPVALGIAVSCGALGASLGLDVRHARIGWRQPLGALATVAFVIGTAPTVLTSISGDWNQPGTTIAQLLKQLPEPTDGHYRTLFLGDSRLVPGAPVSLGGNVSYSVSNDGIVTTDDLWEPTETNSTAAVERAARAIVRGSTGRGGRLLAPFAVRFVVVPVVDGVESTRDTPLGGSAAIVDALADQLDLRRRYSSSEIVVFENTAWLPVHAQMTAAGAEASKSAGDVAVIAGDVSGAAPVLLDLGRDGTARGSASTGVVHAAVPFSERWSLTVGNQTLAPRPAFGVTTAFDVVTSGDAELTYRTPVSRTFFVGVQWMLWLAVLAAAVYQRRARFGIGGS